MLDGTYVPDGGFQTQVHVQYVLIVPQLTKLAPPAIQTDRLPGPLQEMQLAHANALDGFVSSNAAAARHCTNNSRTTERGSLIFQSPLYDSETSELTPDYHEPKCNHSRPPLRAKTHGCDDYSMADPVLRLAEL
jgi:hypothetical protein